MVLKKLQILLYITIFAVSSLLFSNNQLPVEITPESHPTTCTYMSQILSQHQNKIKKIVFLLGANVELQSYDSTLLIPFSWINAIESQNKDIDTIIQNYITTHMKSHDSFIDKINWNNVSMGVMLSCLVVISLHLYKIEKVMKRIDNQIKSNTIFWLCTLPTKMHKHISERFS
jgi:hypothetical protein